AFQRGYSGSARPESAPPRAADPRPPVRSAPADYAPPRIEPHPSPAEPAATPPPVEHADEAEGEPAGVSRDPRRNPFLITVAALGVVCVLGGAFWLSRTQQFFEVGAQTGADFWIVMVSLVGAPLLLALGVAILAGVLFFLA